MHNYLKSIGFSQVRTTKQEKLLIDSILEKPQKKKMISNPNDTDSMYAELSTEFVPGAGIRIIGEYDEYEQFRMDSYYPYFESKNLSMTGDCFINKKMNSIAFSGLAEDERFGVSIIFHVTNTLDCINTTQLAEGTRKREICFSGLGSDGIILLPTLYSEEVLKQRKRANKGFFASAEADSAEGLSLDGFSVTEDDDYDYGMVSDRIRNEDVFSIVETSFIPFGMETELYKVLGIIEKADTFINPILGEKIHVLKLLVNEMTMDICINDQNLSGEPLPGRRFRGIIWLQGKVKDGK